MALSYLALGARLALAVVWAWAGVAKIADPDAATRAVRAYELFPEALVKPIAWGLPFVELGLALLLLLGLAYRPAAWVSAVLFVAFIVMIGSAWARGLSIDCGCFGGGGATNGVDGAQVRAGDRPRSGVARPGGVRRRSARALPVPRREG